MNGIVNYMRGSANVEIYGDNPEQFINSLARHGIPFWKFRKLEKGRATVTIPLSYVREADNVKKCTDCEIKIVRETGIAHFLYSIRRRWVLLFGFFLCFAVVSTFSLFVWDIEVTGNETVPTGEILSVLNKHGVHIGMFSLSINQQDLRNRVLYEIKDLKWITVNIVGTKAEVIVRERTKKPDIVDVKKPSSVIAAKSGIITELNVFQGQPLVNVGQTVSKGDVLVSSEMTSLNSGTRQVHAIADVYARTWYELSSEIPLEYTAKYYTGKVTERNAIILFGKQINLYFSTGFSDTFCDKIIKTKKVTLPGGFVLPITVSTEKLKWYNPQTAVMDKTEAEDILKDGLLKQLEESIGDGSKEAVYFNTEVNNNVLKVTLRAECLEQIGKVQEAN